MTGIVGGTVSETHISSMTESLFHEPSYETSCFTAGEYGLGLIHHGAKDPAGWNVWHDGNRAGIVHGALVKDGANPNTDEILDEILTNPEQALPQIDGPFVVACVDADADRIVLATDKLGSRPCYYHNQNDFSFGSGLPALLTGIDSPAVNEQAVSDMLLMGYVWGEKTLIEEINSPLLLPCSNTTMEK